MNTPVLIRGATLPDGRTGIERLALVGGHIAALSHGLPRIHASGTLLEGMRLRGELKPLLTTKAIVERALPYCDWAGGAWISRDSRCLPRRVPLARIVRRQGCVTPSTR